MTTQEVAKRWHELCTQGDYKTCYEELYSPNCVSLEMPGAMMERAEGLEQMAAKGKAWNESIEEMHSGKIGEPIVGGDHFSAVQSMDVTFKERGRTQFDEVSVYKVKDGKIVQEQFFYES